MLVISNTRILRGIDRKKRYSAVSFLSIISRNYFINCSNERPEALISKHQAPNSKDLKLNWNLVFACQPAGW
jgi:hypothetical protein